MKKLVVKDTLNSVVKDTVLVDIVNAFQHSANQQCFTVHTIAEPKEWYEWLGIIVGIVVGIYTIYYTRLLIQDLKKNDTDAQEQINKLTRMSEVMLARYRLLVKPRLFTNRGGFSGFDNGIHFNLENRGELCYFDGYEWLEGNKVWFPTWQESIDIPKGEKIVFQGKSLEVHPKDIKFKMKVVYHDQEDFKYESIIEWKGTPKIIETKEL